MSTSRLNPPSNLPQRNVVRLLSNFISGLWTKSCTSWDWIFSTYAPIPSCPCFYRRSGVSQWCFLSQIYAFCPFFEVFCRGAICDSPSWFGKWQNLLFKQEVLENLKSLCLEVFVCQIFGRCSCYGAFGSFSEKQRLFCDLCLLYFIKRIDREMNQPT